MPSKHGLVTLTTAVALLLAVCVWFFVQDPARTSAFLPCLFNRLTGLYCPGCGGQRAAHALLHGRIAEAADYNLLFILALAGTLPLAGAALSSAALRLRLQRLLLTPLFLIPLATLVVVFGVLRNLPTDLGKLLGP